MLRKCVHGLILFCVSVMAVASADKLGRSVVIGLAEGVDYVLPYEQAIASAWQDIGFQVRYERLPAQRSLLMSNMGALDGELVRTQIIESGNPNLIRVPVLLSRSELSLYCRKGVICNESVLNKQQNTIGIRAGCMASIAFMKQHAAQIHLISSPDFGEMLNVDSRLKYVLTLGIKGHGNLDSIFDSDELSSIRLQEVDAWHYVHKKHASLVPMLAESLARAKNKWLARYKQSALPD